MITVQPVVVVDKPIANQTVPHMKKMFVPVIDGCVVDVAPIDSEDAALLYGLQLKHVGGRSIFTRLACRMLGINSVLAR